MAKKFHELDKDGSGLLDMTEMKVFVSQMEAKGRFPDGVPEDIYDQILKMADKNADDKISFAEWMAWIGGPG